MCLLAPGEGPNPEKYRQGDAPAHRVRHSAPELPRRGAEGVEGAAGATGRGGETQVWISPLRRRQVEKEDRIPDGPGLVRRIEFKLIEKILLHIRREFLTGLIFAARAFPGSPRLSFLPLPAHPARPGLLRPLAPRFPSGLTSRAFSFLGKDEKGPGEFAYLAHGDGFASTLASATLMGFRGDAFEAFVAELQQWDDENEEQEENGQVPKAWTWTWEKEDGTVVGPVSRNLLAPSLSRLTVLFISLQDDANVTL